MRNEPAADLLSATGKPGAPRRMLKVVIALVALSAAIAGAAWVAGQIFYDKDAASVTTGDPQGATREPARPVPQP
jgi:hypothetical protein